MMVIILMLLLPRVKIEDKSGEFSIDVARDGQQRVDLLESSPLVGWRDDALPTATHVVKSEPHISHG